MKQLNNAGNILGPFLSDKVDNNLHKLFLTLILDCDFFIDEKFILLFSRYFIRDCIAHVL